MHTQLMPFTPAAAAAAVAQAASGTVVAVQALHGIPEAKAQRKTVFGCLLR